MRRWHARLRKADVEIMWPNIKAIARNNHPKERQLYEVLLWDKFTQMEGQEHWRCACGVEDVGPYAHEAWGTE